MISGEVRRFRIMMDSEATLGGVPREQKMLKGHLPRVLCHPVYWFLVALCQRMCELDLANIEV